MMAGRLGELPELGDYDGDDLVRSMARLDMVLPEVDRALGGESTVWRSLAAAGGQLPGRRPDLPGFPVGPEQVVGTNFYDVSDGIVTAGFAAVEGMHGAQALGTVYQLVFDDADPSGAELNRAVFCQGQTDRVLGAVQDVAQGFGNGYEQGLEAVGRNQFGLQQSGPDLDL